ncbi:glycine zipper 2TM domain-containing protein [Dokdonella sp. MW10]|uniref:glycine zipper 2TM domain-containing protein n=1 Tax=Dokdonella sp. MW10 TaxID=2992926 RepID=UPI003F812145
MFTRIVFAGLLTATVAGLAPIKDVEARGSRDRYGCDSCGRVVRIESIGRRDSNVGAGAVIGAIAGGALGNSVGSGDGRKAATVAGAVAGGVIGHNVQKKNRRSNYYYRVYVRMDYDGRTRSYEQSDDYGLRRGDRVMVDRGYVTPY